MIVYGVAGRFIGGAIIAIMYNRILGAVHGIGMDLETGTWTPYLSFLAMGMAGFRDLMKK
jgi:hypothetical protein